MAKKRILIIDDDAGICQVVQVAFKVLTDWQALVASFSQAGIALATAEQPNAILLDVMMPEIDGIATVQKLQEDPRTRHIPIILLTAKAQSKDRERFSQLPIAGVITKPFTAPLLISEIRSILHWEN